MELHDEMDQVYARLLAFQAKSSEVTKELLKMDENVGIIEEHVKEARKEIKSIIRNRCEQEEINAGLSFELEQIHEKEKMVINKVPDVENQVEISIKNFQEDLEKYQETTEKEAESINKHLKLLTDRISNLP